MTEGSLGFVVVPCPRCGQKCRVEVSGEVGTIQRPGWFAIRMVLGAEDVGVCYVKLRASRGGDGHNCGPRPGRREGKRIRRIA